MTTIRPARPSDREFVLALADRLASFDVPAWRSKDEVAEGDRRALAEWFRDAKPDEALFVAEWEGRPAGCAYLMTLVDYFNLQRHAHLSVLAVTAEAWARQCGSDRLTLTALVTNARARALYERRGFGGETIRYVLPLKSG